MADISITAANVVPQAGASISSGTAGVAITAGQTVYNDSTTSTVKLANANTSLATATCAGIAIDNAAINQPVSFQYGGDVAMGTVFTQGEPYFVSANSGAIAPKADLASGNYTVVLGVAKSSSILSLINRGASTLTTHA